MAWTLYQGDCRNILKEIPDNSIDSVVTDPPYELGFMGKSWDSTGIAYDVDMWREVSRVLKPGGYLLSFGGTRTYHRMACAIEDAGFEVRDQMQWIYGSGFPKSVDISKAIDKIAGATRKPILDNNGNQIWTSLKQGKKSMFDGGKERPATYPDGWGTALKPANEPIVVARKPLSEKTVAENVLKWGTGGINIDDCRIETEDKLSFGSRQIGDGIKYGKCIPTTEGIQNPQGRFPANIIFDEEAGKMLDEQSGISKSKSGGLSGFDPGMWKGKKQTNRGGHNDSGGASRFFYCAKASKTERNGSKHPTIKPLALMQYLVRLVTPPNGTVMDPFAGSGTTMQAAVIEDFNAIGIEKELESCKDIQIRMANIEPSLFEEGC